DQLLIFATLVTPKSLLTVTPGFSYGFVLHTNRAQDWSAIFRRDARQVESVRHEGETYTRWSTQPGDLCGYVPDPTTLVLAQQEAIRVMIEDRDAPASRRAWDEVWGGVEKSQIAFAMETRWLRRHLEDYRMSKPGRDRLPFGFTFETISPLFENARA